MDAMGKASNVLAVLLNEAEVKSINILVNDQQRPTKIVAVLVKPAEADLMAALFGEDLDCSVDSDAATGTITINREVVRDGVFDLILATLVH